MIVSTVGVAMPTGEMMRLHESQADPPVAPHTPSWSSVD